MMATSPDTPSASDLLDEAARAWNNFNIGRTTMDRLGQYRHLTPAMQNDRRLAIQKMSAARETLDRVLKVRR